MCMGVRVCMRVCACVRVVCLCLCRLCAIAWSAESGCLDDHRSMWHEARTAAALLSHPSLLTPKVYVVTSAGEAAGLMAHRQV